ncbi:MAG: hypothetical protein ACYDAR_20635 [Thermomicrobiales bacterium]
MKNDIEAEQIDVAATIAALRTQAIARGKAMGLTEQASLDDPLRQAADLAHVSAHFPIMWRVPIVGRGLSLVQRAMRIGLRWYINPIVDQINDFNEATITALNTIVARQEALAARIAALELEVGPNPPAPCPTGEGGELGMGNGDTRPSETPLSRMAGEGPGVGAAS